MDIVDTHQHLWDLSRHKTSWCAGIPALNRSFVMSDYQAAVADLPLGYVVKKAVYLEGDVDETDMPAEANWALELAAAKDNPTAGVVAACRPEHDARVFERYIAQFAANPFFKGVRRVLHTQADDFSSSSQFVKNVQSLSRYKLSFDLCFLARQLPVAIELARQCPGVTMILDHCGVPNVKDQALDPWRDHIKQLAALPHVNCKISGIVAYADAATWKPSDLRPFVEYVIECFGWDRVIFGSDWPVCLLSARLSQWVAALDEVLRGATLEQKQKLFNSNAARIYRLS